MLAGKTGRRQVLGCCAAANGDPGRAIRRQVPVGLSDQIRQVIRYAGLQGQLSELLPNRADFLMTFYWPVVVVLCICFLATLYHVSVPVRTKWTFNLPGATFSLFCWIAGSYVLRWVLTVTAAESRSIYGPLAAPIAVLLWLYLLALAVLIGAAVNAAFDTVWPQKSTTRARLEMVQRLRERISVRDS